MRQPFCIFKLQGDGDLHFVEAMQTFDDAKARVREIGELWPGAYGIENVETGERVLVSIRDEPKTEAMNNTLPICPKHDTAMVPHVPFPKDVSYPQGNIRSRCPNLDCPIVYVEGTFDGLYVLEVNGKLKVYAD